MLYELGAEKMEHSKEQDKWNNISTVNDYIQFLENKSIAIRLNI